MTIRRMEPEAASDGIGGAFHHVAEAAIGTGAGI
jgi:hypothetical protein